MSYVEYEKAQKLGLKAFKNAVSKGENEYLPVLDEILEGVSEIFVYSDDVNKVIKEFPDIKVAAYSYDENSGKISVCYSESGYPMFTDKYETGYCDIKDKSAWVSTGYRRINY